MTESQLTSHDGLSLAGEAHGSGPGVLFVHANGFCKELWRPVWGRVAGIRALAIDQRGHGASEIGSPPFDWWDLGRDAAAWAATLEGPRVGVGHSSGAAALAMAEILHPGSFRHLVLIEPIVFPGPFARAESHPLVDGALRRRTSFSTRAETRAAFHRRGPFARWVDAALDLYVEHGFRDGPDDRRHLACAPATEAEFYRMATAHGAWNRLGEIDIAVTIVVGEHSDSHPPDFAATLAARFRHATLVSYPGASHFLPMEKPETVAELVEGLVTEP